MCCSFIVYDTGFAGSPRTNTWVFGAFVAMTLHLVFLGATLAVMAGLGIKAPEYATDFHAPFGANTSPLWSPSVWACFCMIGAVCLTHGLGGRWHNGEGVYQF